MKKIIFIILTLFMTISLFAKESNLDYYKPMYFILGNSDDQVKVQISFKYNLWKFNDNNNIYFGYSQYMYWDLYKSSGPFREINYNPEGFYLLINPISNVDYIQFSPIEHLSNGKDEKETRGVNNIYGEIQVSTQTKLNFGTSFRTWYSYMSSHKNENIMHYSGNNSVKIFMQLLSEDDEYYTDKEELYIKVSTFVWKEIKLCNYEIGLKFRMVTSLIQPYFFINFVSDYNKKDTALRSGIILNY